MKTSSILGLWLLALALGVLFYGSEEGVHGFLAGCSFSFGVYFWWTVRKDKIDSDEAFRLWQAKQDEAEEKARLAQWESDQQNK